MSHSRSYRVYRSLRSSYLFTFYYVFSSKGGDVASPRRQLRLEEAQLGDLSPVITRAAARRNAERLAALQQAKQFSPGSSTSKGKDPEHNPSPPMTPDQLRLDRLEIDDGKDARKHSNPRRNQDLVVPHVVPRVIPRANLLPQSPRRRMSLPRTLRSPPYRSPQDQYFGPGPITTGPINCPISYDQILRFRPARTNEISRWKMLLQSPEQIVSPVPTFRATDSIPDASRIEAA